MTTDLDALEALAKAATPGPWLIGNSQMYGPSAITRDADGLPQIQDSWVCDADAAHPNAAFIAAADPSTVLALIAELRQERERADGEAHDARHLRSIRDYLRADRDRLHKAITEAVEILTRGDNADPAGEAWRILRAALEQRGSD